MRKGLTPVIAVVVLLLIAAALAGASWFYTSTYVGGLTKYNIEVRDYFMIGSRNAVILIANMGNNDVPVSEISIYSKDTGQIAQGTWADISGIPLPGPAVEIGEMARWTSDFTCNTTEECTFFVVSGAGKSQEIVIRDTNSTI
ncbi:MAG: hypothetical protein JSV63_00195 [Candidatus Aenigmatarchaeota archaeon]|nr:MAG: hypothetical protein JSV63_00195 [Candidatus Aenigmarchaeota archaeon]